MKTIIEIKDVSMIRELVTINNAYLEISYDGSPPVQDFQPRGIWLVLLESEYTAGFINVECLNNVTWIPHICIYELYRGNNSEEWGVQAIKYMKDKYGATKFLAFTPYKVAKKYAEKLGFKYIHTL